MFPQHSAYTRPMKSKNVSRLTLKASFADFPAQGLQHFTVADDGHKAVERIELHHLEQLIDRF